MFPIERRDIDRSYLALRFLAAAMSTSWVAYSPLLAEQKRILYALIILFVLATIVLAATGRMRTGGYRNLYGYFLLPDIIMLTAFVQLAGPTGGYLAIGYIIITGLAAFYYGARTGYVVGGITSVVNLGRMIYLSTETTYFSDALLQLGLIWITALTIGSIAKRAESSREAIKNLNRELEHKITTLASASRIISSATDLKKLVYLLRESLDSEFGIECYCFYLIDKDEKRILTSVYQGIDKEAERTISLAVIDRLGLIESRSVHKKDGPFVLPKDLSARLWRLPGGEMSPSLVRNGNETIGVLCLNENVLESFDEGQKDVLVSIFNQLTVSMENAYLYERLKGYSVTDHLTRVYNRRYLQGYLGDEIKRCRRYTKALSVVMLDLDNFKKYNDSYGHLQGDVALQEFADILRGSCRDADIVARYGGEEFAIVLPETSYEGALTAVEKVRQMIAGHAFLGANAMRSETLTASFGIAAYPEDGHGSRDLLSHADKALYLAKSHGKNRLVAFREMEAGYGTHG